MTERAKSDEAPSEPGACEVLMGFDGDAPIMCGRRAARRYPALGGGYMHLCRDHAHGHELYSEWWSGAQWQAPEQVVSR